MVDLNGEIFGRWMKTAAQYKLRNRVKRISQSQHTNTFINEETKHKRQTHILKYRHQTDIQTSPQAAEQKQTTDTYTHT